MSKKPAKKYVLIVVTKHVNPSSPQFTSGRYIIFVSEGVPLSSDLFNLDRVTSDPDSQTLTFALISEIPAPNNVNAAYFELNGAVLRNKRTFDREAIAEYNISVSVSDSSNNVSILVSVHVSGNIVCLMYL